MSRLAVLILATGTSLQANSLLDFTYGAFEEVRGNEEAASKYYKSAYDKNPTALPLVRIEVNRLLDAKERGEAFAVYEETLESRPDDTMLRIEFGDFLARVGKGDGVADMKRREAYEDVLKMLPGDYLPIERLIRFSRDQGNDDRARKLLEELKLDSPEAVRYYVSTTKSLYDSRDKAAKERVSKSFSSAMEDHPEWADIARVASDHFREIGDLEKAISILHRHIEVRPSSLDLHIRMGILMFVADRDSEGVEILRQVLEIHPKKALAHESLAKHFRQSGEMVEARHHAAELLKLRGGSAEDFMELADEMAEAGEVRSARLLLEKAAFDFSEDADLMMKLALVTARDPETSENAARLFREAENMLENPADMSPEFLLQSARELIAQGKGKAAEERLRNAIRNFPPDAKAESAAAMRELAGIWISENRNLDAAGALKKRADALEK
ncbi:MAG: tetratricopeptide repeat protein [Luteolibacter sp.]